MLVERYKNICHFTLQEIITADTRIIIKDKPKKLKKKRWDSNDSNDSSDSSDSSDFYEDSIRKHRRNWRSRIRRILFSSK